MSNEDEQAQYEELMAERPGFLGDEEIRYRKLAQLGERVLEILRPYRSQYAGVPENSDTAARMLDILRARNELGLLDEGKKP